VPTPFYHLWIAQDLLDHPGLGLEARVFLNRHRAAFLFGNTAPDVQVVSRQPRQDTHFFEFPIYPGQPSPVDAMLAVYPQFRNLFALPADQAAFLVGYLCHLQADWLWVRQIFDPIFGSRAAWAEVPHRLYIHNVLRSYLDQKVIPRLAQDMGACLALARPQGWLPFVEDHFLSQWRDELHPQLQGQTLPHTVEVFAARQGIPVEAYYELLNSEERMQREVFIHLSSVQLKTYRSHLLAESVQLVSRSLERPVPGSFSQAAAGVIPS
jgi:hypothetical protein